MPAPRKIQRNIYEVRTKNIAQQLKTLRKKRGLTQIQLAEQLGLTQAAIASYESGRIHIVDVVLIDLAKALNVSADELLGIKKNKPTLPEIGLRFLKRILTIENFPEIQKKRILRNLDDAIVAFQNKR